MSCKNTEETALVYGPSHLDETVALTKCIYNIIRCALIVTPPTFLYKGRETGLSPPVNILLTPVNISLTIPRWCFFCGSFLLVMLHVDVCYAVASVLCSLVVTCWEKADLLAVVCVVFCYFPKCVLVYI